VDAETLLYEFTLNDPKTFTRPWTAQVPMTKNPGQIYEYACHEGNYGMFGILSGARAEEKATATGGASCPSHACVPARWFTPGYIEGLAFNRGGVAAAAGSSCGRATTERGQM
jgi:hypothetical protein